MSNSQKREVVLIRHGKPLSAHNDKVNAAQYAKWVSQYNKSVLDPQSAPRSKTHLNESYIVVSPLLRAKLSAVQYGVKNVDEECDLLKEMDIPYYKLPFRMRAWHWVVLSRFLWFIGFKGRFESFRFAKKRVFALSNRIESLSCEHARIVLFGHGMTNYFTRNQLMVNGWQLKQKDGDYWGITRLIK